MVAAAQAARERRPLDEHAIATRALFGVGIVSGVAIGFASDLWAGVLVGGFSVLLALACKGCRASMEGEATFPPRDPKPKR